MNTQTLFGSSTEGSWAGRHAVVVGGSIGGLLAARVLADHFERVTVVDRDRFPEEPDHRKGVPQSRHAHTLLERGQRIISRLFPGIADDLCAEGAVHAGGAALVIVSPVGKLPLGEANGEDPGEQGFFASRFLLEWQVRRRLAGYEGVSFLTDREVVGLTATGDNGRVTGVRLRRRDTGGDDESSELLDADLVVDASGRHSKAPRWLVDLGYQASEEETINSGIGYASCFYKKPADWPAEWEGIIVNGRPPDNPRAGAILPTENDTWHVTVSGFAGNYPPIDEEGFLEWARQLPDPSIYEAIRVAEQITPIRGYRTPQNRLRHFERLGRWPEGFIVTGDAVCAFNPIYGQGMTVAAMDAQLLEESLRRQRRSARPGFERRFQKELAKVVAVPWLVSSGEDLRWGVESTGAKSALSTGFTHRYMDLVLRRASKDAVVARTYMNVLSMVERPRSLFGPKILPRVLWEATKQIGAALGRRASDPEEELALSPEAISRLRARPAARSEAQHALG
jgi:2-polyprenyl-6-methoxyphenol hydroxylase-like FAD-dependent oxidoreductase